MKRCLTVLAFALLAGAAGLGGSLLHQRLAQPQEVHAQSMRAEKGIRIALLNLEAAARSSKKFGDLKLKWDETQQAMKAEMERLQADHDKLKAEVRAAQATGDIELALTSQAQQSALQETMEVTRKQQGAYLQSLLNQYQKEVLVEVMAKAEEYCKKEGFDLLLQDYTLDATESGFFSGGAYAETLMNKPVLYAPGLKDLKNAYVVDITAAIGGISTPDRPKENSGG